MKRDREALSSRSCLVTFVLLLPSASLMFLICVLKLIPCYQREEHLHVLPAHSPKTWSRKLPEANINIKLKICRTSLFTETIRLLLSLSCTQCRSSSPTV